MTNLSIVRIVEIKETNVKSVKMATTLAIKAAGNVKWTTVLNASIG